METDAYAVKKLKDFDPLPVALRNQKSKKDEHLNLHKHMNEVMNHAVIHCPDDALN